MKILLATRFPLALLVAVGLTAGSAGAEPSARTTQASARAYSIRILVPGQPVQGTQAVAAPPDAVSLGGTFSYPDDGSIVTTESISASASTDAGVRTSAARASSEVEGLQLFGGELTAAQLVVRPQASAGPTGASATGRVANISQLTILGQPVVPQPNAVVQLADWGTATLLEQATDDRAPAGRNAAHAVTTALRVRLTLAHAGLPVGSEIIVASAETAAQAKAAPKEAPPPPPPPKQAPQRAANPPPAQHTHAKSRSRAANVPRTAPEPKRSPFGTAPVRPIPRAIHPKLTGSGFVFPVYGPASFTDTFGAPRADVAWHHGGDIFAPLGAPVLAVTKGVVFSVGWNDLGGNRLWLRDPKGNQFYYAHLSAYSPLAVNGGRVNAGDVLGFVGNTGDAINTPYHLHFEVHPVQLLGKGYDGVIDPTAYLLAWQRLRNLSFAAGLGEQAKKRIGAAAAATAPQPGAILLQVADISSATALDRQAIRAALAAGADIASSEGQAALLGLANRG